jgi:uncharacterized protein YbaP (TraB family)
MEKTSKGIFEFLCKQMEQLDKKVISVEHLKAQGNAAKQLNNLLKYELDRAKAVQKFKDIDIRNIEGNEPIS